MSINEINEQKNMLFTNKYQPKFFRNFEIDQDIIRFLRMLIKIEKLNIILIGDIASGKTTLLNAIVREYYYGYEEKDYKDNVLYINNLKEQGITYFRSDVKTFCQTKSIFHNKKRTIVLDDVDIINEQSQQVFRNYIDKYSNNVNFICSCNNTQKVIESLQSRLTIIRLFQLKKENLYKILNDIKLNEMISIDEKASDFIINVSNNTPKILLNYLEKFKLLDEHITLELAQKLCTNINFSDLEKYTECIKNKNIEDAIAIIYKIYDRGFSVMDILDSYFIFIKTTSMLDETQKYDIIPYICKYITIFHNIHEDEIELALFTNNIANVIY